MAAPGTAPGLSETLRVLQDGQHGIAESERLEDPHIDVEGFSLLDASRMKAVRCTAVLVDEKEAPPPLTDGTGHLLRVVECRFEQMALRDVVSALAERLELRVRLSEAADAKWGERLITLNKGEVTGAEAIEAVAGHAGLVARVRDGTLWLELENDPGDRSTAEEF